MYGLAKIAMDEETKQQFDEAFTPQGYRQVERNTKPENAAALGITSGLLGGLSGSIIGKKTALAGAGVGGLLGGTVGYQKGRKGTINKPIYSDEQSQAQEGLYAHPDARDYFERYASKWDLGLAKVANDQKPKEKEPNKLKSIFDRLWSDGVEGQKQTILLPSDKELKMKSGR